jgi:hypothetical protein
MLVGGRNIELITGKRIFGKLLNQVASKISIITKLNFHMRHLMKLGT